MDNIKTEFESEINDCKNLEQLERIRVKYLGKAGIVTKLIKSIKDLDAEERPMFGAKVNELKTFISHKIKLLYAQFQQQRYESIPQLDVTLPGIRPRVGKQHIITRTLNEIIAIFKTLGFTIAFGPEIETDYYNFEALNMPKDHPARDMQATFYLQGGLILRTHTSAVQVRYMEKHKPPIMIIAPGKVYRCDDDISHIPMFHQVEGLMVDEKTNFSHLKGVLTYFVKQFFGEDTNLRFRPSFFPYTEPSAEIDIQCVICEGKGCRTCKNTGWQEILGAGMVNPAVFKFVNYNPNKYQGFAFGMGVERIAMLKYKIDDIRIFYENDMRFLAQF